MDNYILLLHCTIIRFRLLDAIKEYISFKVSVVWFFIFGCYLIRMVHGSLDGKVYGATYLRTKRHSLAIVLLSGLSSVALPAPETRYIAPYYWVMALLSR